MTAIVGVLNKHAVALATDSAVTISTRTNGSNQHKVLNSANKLFNLSRNHPVGVMIYSDSCFMGTPWDLIIKLYREQLKDQSFPKLEDYVDNFIDFLKNNRYFCSNNVQMNCLLNHILWFYKDVKAIAVSQLNKKAPTENEIHAEMINVLREHIDRFSKFPKCKDFERYDYSIFLTEAKAFLDIVNRQALPYLTDPKSFYDLFAQAYYTYLCSVHIISLYTGIVFAGYGDDDIFPALIPVHISFAFNGKLRYAIDKDNVNIIDENKTAAICPFAQTDVMMTFMTGIDQSIQGAIYKKNSTSMVALRNAIVNELKSNGIPETIIKNCRSLSDKTIEAVQQDFVNVINKFIGTNKIKQLVETVGYLDIEDLANMAESLVSLTGLNRRITSSEEGVGGPVDVAVISKCDGFIWMKRKLYFDKDINAQFFSRYK